MRARYARLCEDGILQVTAVTNPLGLGFEAEALIGIRTSGSPEVLADELAQWDEADYVVITAGRFDVLVEVLCVDRRHLLDVTTRIRALDGVHSTESFLYLELWKQLYDWGARTTGRYGKEQLMAAAAERAGAEHARRGGEGPQDRRAQLRLERGHRRRLDGARLQPGGDARLRHGDRRDRLPGADRDRARVRARRT